MIFEISEKKEEITKQNKKKRIKTLDVAENDRDKTDK